jgi:hypothetical protein
MRSSDVSSVYIDRYSNPEVKFKAIDIGSNGSCRVFSVIWCPYRLNVRDQPRIQLWAGDPDDSDSEKIYEAGAVRGGEGSFSGLPSLQQGQRFLSFSPLPSHYFLFNKDVWVIGIAPGINNATLTYQLGG